jgi:hypothetical protein
MEVGFHSFILEGKGKLYSQSVLFFLLAIGIFLWGNVIVFAGPSSINTIDKDSRIPLSKKVLEPSKSWRTSKKSKNLWRKSEEDKLSLQKGRIKKKPSSLYDPIKDRDNWDPYSFDNNKGIHTQPPTIFKFRF